MVLNYILVGCPCCKALWISEEFYNIYTCNIKASLFLWAFLPFSQIIWNVIILCYCIARWGNLLVNFSLFAGWIYLTVGTPDFKWQGWSNGGKNQNPINPWTKTQPPKKSPTEFPSHKNLQKALNDITRKIETLVMDRNVYLFITPSINLCTDVPPPCFLFTYRLLFVLYTVYKTPAY